MGVCLRNKIAKGSKEYLGGELMLMLFHLEIMREKEGGESVVAWQYPRGIISPVVCVFSPLGSHGT